MVALAGHGFSREHLHLAYAYRRRQADGRAERRAYLEASWRTWLTDLFPETVSRGFAPYHEAFWAWVWAIGADDRPRPYVTIWPRGFAKSTSAELACAMMAARQTRHYGLYVCETQDQADDHVANVAALLESAQFGAVYPTAASRRVGKYGNSQGWRRNRLRTTSGITLDAIGLDSAARGVKLENQRPDLMIFDDLDGETDSPAATEKKMGTLTRKLIPAGSRSTAIIAVQNLILPNGIFARLADGRADFLVNRVVSGPHPAIADLSVDTVDGRAVITGGTPTWEAMDLGVCQALMDDEGVTAFLAERQHEVADASGGMFDRLTFRHCAPHEVPDLVKTVVWVDPAVTDTAASDSHAVQADGLAPDGTIYRLRSWEGRTSPEDSLRRAILWAVDLGAANVGVETDQGGDTWQSVYREAVRKLVAKGLVRVDRVPGFQQAKAGGGHGPKAHRASQMLADYELGRIVHVIGTHETLERALRRFPKTKPFDLVDAAYWSWVDVRPGGALTVSLDYRTRDDDEDEVSPW